MKGGEDIEGGEKRRTKGESIPRFWIPIRLDAGAGKSVVGAFFASLPSLIPKIPQFPEQTNKSETRIVRGFTRRRRCYLSTIKRRTDDLFPGDCSIGRSVPRCNTLFTLRVHSLIAIFPKYSREHLFGLARDGAKIRGGKRWRKVEPEESREENPQRDDQPPR